MESKRQKQVAREIQKEISKIFQKKGLTVVQGAMLTITRVFVTPDLLQARIYISIFNAKDSKEAILALIEAHNKEIRYELGNAMRHQLRRIPELEFFLDDSLDQVYRIDEIFKDLNKGDKK